MDNRTVSSRLRELVKFLATVKGDLANVTGPPSLLAPSSVTEVGHCWAQRPALFSAPAHEPLAEKRHLLVLKWFLVALRSQLYVAGGPGVSIKKPLNAFLGELFLASWTDEEAKATTELVAEQVSHHPPITAMHISDRRNGVRADGYARVEMGFNGNVNIRQVGHAMVHIDKYDEDHLVPLPDVKVRGFLGGCLYPEISGQYSVVSGSGYVTEIKFSGEGMMRGKRNSFEAKTYSPGKQSVFYTVTGVWSEGWTVKDARSGEVLEVFDHDAAENDPVPMDLVEEDQQDAFESRKAWGKVLDGLAMGELDVVSREKGRIEKAQREMRAMEQAEGRVWEPLLFKAVKGEEFEVFHRLAKGQAGWDLQEEKTRGVWRVVEEVEGMERPFRAGLTPLGY
ncbi:hypothetical protein QBC35DRAFT_439409 [Podospora australis]|uniref:Oxysterol-binding protein n=1 Tax=Podospora australis TaxID=1536484 RepID=A0AAN6WP54_9PEZI|nr:hypothetical protein QBC35DRAFT_439409 [Podospora australis]